MNHFLVKTLKITSWWCHMKTSFPRKSKEGERGPGWTKDLHMKKQTWFWKACNCLQQRSNFQHQNNLWRHRRLCSSLLSLLEWGYHYTNGHGFSYWKQNYILHQGHCSKQKYSGSQDPCPACTDRMWHCCYNLCQKKVVSHHSSQQTLTRKNWQESIKSIGDWMRGNKLHSFLLWVKALQVDDKVLTEDVGDQYWENNIICPKLCILPKTTEAFRMNVLRHISSSHTGMQPWRLILLILILWSSALKLTKQTKCSTQPHFLLEYN